MNSLAQTLNFAVHNLDDVADQTSNKEVRRLIARAVRTIEQAETLLQGRKEQIIEGRATPEAKPTARKIRVRMYSCKPMCFGPDGHRKEEGARLNLKHLEARWMDRPMAETLTVEAV